MLSAILGDEPRRNPLQTSIQLILRSFDLYCGCLTLQNPALEASTYLPASMVATGCKYEKTRHVEPTSHVGPFEPIKAEDLQLIGVGLFPFFHGVF